MKRAVHLLMKVTTACIVITTLSIVAFAQETPNTASADIAPINAPTQPAGPDAASKPTAEVKGKSIGGMIVSGGVLNVFFFGVLGVFSIWSVTVVLERCVNLRREKLLPHSFALQLNRILESPQPSPQNFRALCEGASSPVSRIFHAGVLRAGRSVPEVEKAMEDAAAREMSALRAKSRPLSVVGNIAPLVGLLGTVVGMIIAFQISSQEGLGKAERLAEGIYLALMTTAAGLTIAIPCLLFASFFAARAERFMCDIDECLMESIPSFARMEGATVNSGSRPATGAAQDPVQDAVPDPVNDADMSPRDRFLHEGMTGVANG